MMPRLRLVFVCLVIVGAVAGRASAQEADSAQEGRFRLGPLRFTPSILLSDVGVDNNVFNDPEHPREDKTAAVGPSVNLWMRAGRSRLTGKVSGQYLYFKQYDDQRAWNTSDELKWAVPLGRITPFIAGTYANTKNRPGYEIDSRARQATDSATLGSELRLSAKTNLILSRTRQTFAFDEKEMFLGANLANALNRRTAIEQFQLRYSLTSLTTFVVIGEGEQDRFTIDPLRDADSIKVMPGFEMKPSALIAGRIFVGYRRFNPLNAAVPEFQGVIASTAATYTARATKVDITVSRDVAFSFEASRPYYALTDAGLVLTERITHSWDLVLRGSGQRLDYKQVAPLPGSPAGNVDTIRQYGGGIGYRIGRTVRLGVDGTYYRRRSSVAAFRDFAGARFGASVSYGLSQ